ncbi:hypothetical protein [Streptomyces sp. PT12]|uniref:hypothetical protein n=1 Tax=Streptomyces sp. PT12 TaxID=1510197 RepID=UPI00285298D1|nr:hypothetical protein [Streptomyces sp. PT12]
MCSALTGTLARSRVYSATRLPRLHLAGLSEGSSLAFDGEAGPAPASLLLERCGAT